MGVSRPAANQPATLGFSFKRQREHQELVDIDRSTIHERKKPCSLTLRTSARVFQNSSLAETQPQLSGFGLSALTPVESSDDDDDDDAEYEHVLVLRAEMDIDNDACVPLPSSHAMASNHDGSIQLSPIPNSLITQSLTISERQGPRTAISIAAEDQGPALSSDHSGQDHEEIQNPVSWCDQRLPSPVSDCGDAFPNSKSFVGNSSIMHDVSPPFFSSSDQRKPNCQQDIYSTDTPMEVASATKLNKVLNKKVTFSMGFRADCDKCHRKVPGHYSHIMRA